MLWSEWYAMLTVIPSAILLLFLKDGARAVQISVKHSVRRVRRRSRATVRSHVG